ncbi:MAG: Rieske (2Fe-2S) protein [Candidatus Rokubacteria bacterium]|nr:Rieske (2Fe-2S) protein [Candidatus Rokubacteria bacterium]
MPRVRAGRLDALTPNHPTLRIIDARRIALVRVGDTVHALDDACPHAGGPLSEGAVDRGALICPYHTWFWDLETGACLAPARGARAIVYPVTIEAGEVWLDLP